MTPETREKAIKLISNKKHTVDSINEIVTILMLEKTILLNEKSVFDDWEIWQLSESDHNIMLWELDIVRRSLDEARKAWYTNKVEELEALIADPVNVAERFEEIEKKRPRIG